MSEDKVEYCLDGTVKITETVEYTRTMSQIDYELTRILLLLRPHEKDALLNEIIPRLTDFRIVTDGFCKRQKGTPFKKPDRK